jgi:hypothetical protein
MWFESLGIWKARGKCAGLGSMLRVRIPSCRFFRTGKFARGKRNVVTR